MQLVTQGSAPHPGFTPDGLASQPSESVSPHRYAILEDHPFMAKMVSDMLTSVGMEVQIFLLGADLPKSPDLLKFKALILDLSLPDMDGMLVMDKLAKMSFGAPIVIISGHSVDVLEAAKLYGTSVGLNIAATLAKPFSSAELHYALNIFP